MKIYYRYIFGKMLTTSLMMLVLFTAIVWSIEILNIGRGGILVSFLGGFKFLYLCSLIIPYDTTLIWPMAMFFGILMTIHQMQQKGEFLAFRYLGLSHYKLFSPILFFAICSTCVCYYITMQVAPTLYKELRIRQSAAEERAILSLLHKKKFNNFNGVTIYFDHIDNNGAAKNITIWQQNTNKKAEIIVADYLKFIKRHDGITMILLENATNYTINSNDKEKSSISNSRAVYITLSSIISPQKKYVMEKSFYVVGISQLYEDWIINNSGSAKAEFHSRILRPFYSIIMAIFIYGVMAARTNMRNNELSYMLKYILSFILLTIFGVESTKFFVDTQFWYLCYIIALSLLLYGIYKIIRLNKFLN
jgi:lipopolysaccharide export LptBFGC system permease protein LptF